jgi:hypothetical protein
MWQHVWNLIKIVEGRQRKIGYMKMMKCVAYWMCKIHANLKRYSDCHETLKLTTRMRASKFSQFCQIFQAYDKKCKAPNIITELQSFQITKRTWASQDSRICRKSCKLRQECESQKIIESAIIISSLRKECDSHKILGSATVISSLRQESESHKIFGSATVMSSLRQEFETHEISESATIISSLRQECESHKILGSATKISSLRKNVSLTTFSDLLQKFQAYDKNMSLTKFWNLSQKFQAYDKNVSLTRFSNLSQKFQAYEKMWLKQFPQNVMESSIVRQYYDHHKILRLQRNVQACVHQTFNMSQTAVPRIICSLG